MENVTRTIEIFRAGRHRTVAGAEIAFTEDEVAAIAGAYDPQTHEAPAVVGHPKLDGPAYGWVKGLSADGGSLKADVQLTPVFAEAVKDGHYRKVSAAFYAPDQVGNPNPGSYYLRHLGFLGAQPPAIKGLEAFQFADGVDDGLVVIEVDTAFAEAEASDVTGIGRVVSRLVGMVARMRDYVADRDGAEAADRIADARELDWMRDDASELVGRASERMRVDGPPHFSEPPQPTPDPNPEDTQVTDPTKTNDKDLAQRETAFAEREQHLQKREADIAKQEISTAIDQMVSAGTVLPANKDALVAFASALDDGAAVAFAEGTDAKTPRRFFLDFLASQPKSVEFAELAAGQDQVRADGHFVSAPGFAVDQAGLEIHEKALAFAEANQVDYSTAVKAVSDL
ncbi:MAG TPA: peptidase [Rhodospirillaceae bacterium]|nr:peptidase [Magnetovibrio sp.]HCS70083.1 peptidase [Rhodospirillaceae bacterium]